MVRRHAAVPSRIAWIFICASVAATPSFSLGAPSRTPSGQIGATPTSTGPLASASTSASTETSTSDGLIDSKQACVAAYENHQVLRRQGNLVEARRVLFACIQTSCPAFVRTDCSTWLLEVEKAIPTVLVAVQVDGHDRLDASVVIDGDRRADALGGKPLELNPGPHTFRVEVAGHAPQERVVLLREGDKLRQVTIVFERPRPPPQPQPRITRPVPWGAWALAGVGVVSLGAFVTAASLGQADRASLERTCKPFCTNDQLNDVRTTYLIADIALGTSIATLSAAAIWYFVRPQHIEWPRRPSGRLPVVMAITPAPEGVSWVAQGEF